MSTLSSYSSNPNPFGGCHEHVHSASLDTRYSILTRPGFLSQTQGRQFILDFENSIVRSPSVTDATDCPLSEP
ncbi:hypothetical protein Tco_0035383, partial [Tanacetum coccineum]